MSSIIKVDNIQDQCGTAVITKCGATHTVTAEVYKADTIQDTSGNAYLAKCGTTVTLGASGDTIQLACGASQTGFGRTGTVNWDTTAKTTNFTAVSGTGYFVNTTSGAITLTLPATPSAGDIVAFKDYANTFDTNNLTLGRNGSPIAGESADAVISVEGQSGTLVYVDGTKGWMIVNASTDADLPAPLYVAATGGTVTCCGDYKIHTFTGPGTFTVTCAGNPIGSTTVDYLVVAGGGGGGNFGGGGGGGGYRESCGTCYTSSPLGSCVSALPVTAQGYPITVGGGGAGSPGCGPSSQGSSGSNSVFSTITSTGGGGGGGNIPGCVPAHNGIPGGSGGGASKQNSPTSTVGSGNTPPVSPPQGNDGGNAGGTTGCHAAGAGGGATAAGGNGTSGGPAGTGGTGATSSINGTPTGRAGGGGGGGSSAGASCKASSCGSGADTDTAASNNTGGGGGGSSCSGGAGAGGSGIVIIRYKYQ